MQASSNEHTLELNYLIEYPYLRVALKNMFCFNVHSRVVFNQGCYLFEQLWQVDSVT